MTAPIRDIAALDVPLTEAHMAEQKRIAVLLAARLAKPLDSESDRIAYADAAHLIETHARVATNEDYVEWFARLQNLPTYFRAKEAS